MTAPTTLADKVYTEPQYPLDAIKDLYVDEMLDATCVIRC